MPFKEQVFASADTKEAFARTWPNADDLVKEYGVKLSPKKPDFSKLADLVVKIKRNGEYVVSFDGKTFKVHVRAGSHKEELGKFDVSAIRDLEEERKVRARLSAANLFSEMYEWNNAHPDAGRIAFWQGMVDKDEEEKIKIETKLKYLHNFTFDYRPLAELYSELKDYADKRSQGHYLNFIAEVDSSQPPPKIFEKYIVKNACFPVNLSSRVFGAIEAAINASKVPNFSDARKEIVGVVNKSVIPSYRKEAEAAIHKRVKELKEHIEANKRLIAGKR